MRVAIAREVVGTGEIVAVPELSTTLSDGRVGWYQRDFSDCLRCAVATATGIDYDAIDLPEAPPIHPGRRIVLGLDQFVAAHGLTYRTFGPEDAPEGVWVAFSPALPHGDCHVFTKRGSDPYHDPWNFIRPDGSPYPEATRPGSLDVAFGLQLTRKDTP